MLIWLIVALWCFPGSFRHNICPLSSKLIFFYWVGLSYANHKRKSSLCLRISIIPQEIVVSNYIAIACIREHSIIENTHTSLTSLNDKNINSQKDQGASEGPTNRGHIDKPISAYTSCCVTVLFALLFVEWFWTFFNFWGTSIWTMKRHCLSASKMVDFSTILPRPD